MWGRLWLFRANLLNGDVGAGRAGVVADERRAKERPGQNGEGDRYGNLARRKTYATTYCACGLEALFHHGIVVQIVGTLPARRVPRDQTAQGKIAGQHVVMRAITFRG